MFVQKVTECLQKVKAGSGVESVVSAAIGSLQVSLAQVIDNMIVCVDISGNNVCAGRTLIK